MKVREAVSQLRSSFKLYSSDNAISDRAISKELKSVALLLIKQQTDRRKLMGSSSIFTEIECLEMEKVPLAECCDYTSPCSIGKSKKPIPKVAENIYGPLAQGVFSIDKKSKFTYMDVNRYANFLRLYPENNKKTFWIKNNHLYISDPNITVVSLSAYFEEDFDVSLYKCNCTNEDKCPQNPLDADFKCPGFLLNNVMTITRDNLLRTYKQSQEDPQENNKDEAR